MPRCCMAGDRSAALEAEARQRRQVGDAEAAAAAASPTVSAIAASPIVAPASRLAARAGAAAACGAHMREDRSCSLLVTFPAACFRDRRTASRTVSASTMRPPSTRISNRCAGLGEVGRQVGEPDHLAQRRRAHARRDASGDVAVADDEVALLGHRRARIDEREARELARHALRHLHVDGALADIERLLLGRAPIPCRLRPDASGRRYPGRR